MPRDYKHTRRKARPTPAPGWVWMLFGLVIGLSASLLIYLDQRPASSPADHPVAPSSTRSSSTIASVEEEPRTRFDFYELLPKFEVIIPERERDVRLDDKPAVVDTPGAYVLQAGSFQNFADADRRRATLAMQGITSRIQKVSIDQDTWHRVRIGPIHDLTELNGVRQRLRDAEIEVLMIRVGD